MNAFQALRIQQASGITDDESAVHVGARHGIPAAVRNGFCAVANELAAVQDFLDERMSLELLKRFVRIEERIVIFQGDDHAERNTIVAQAVHPAAAVQVRAKRPAERVRDVSGINASGLHVPQFFYANAVNLRIQAVEF